MFIFIVYICFYTFLLLGVVIGCCVTRPPDGVLRVPETIREKMRSLDGKYKNMIIKATIKSVCLLIWVVKFYVRNVCRKYMRFSYFFILFRVTFKTPDVHNKQIKN